MSRIGNKPITVPAGIDVTIDGQKITVKGPKGTLERTVNDNISIKLENGVIVVARPNDEKENRSLHGLTRTLINNMIEGVSNEFSKQLEINGVGYRAAKQGNKIVLNVYNSVLDLTTILKNVIEDCANGTKIEISNGIKASNLEKFNVGIAREMLNDFENFIALMKNFVR